MRLLALDRRLTIGALAASAGLMLCFENCSNGVTIHEAANYSSQTTPVCSPFSNGTASVAGANSGVAATLTYLPVTSQVLQKNNLSVTDFLPGAPDVQLVPSTVYLNQISIFTQDFKLGFQDANGTPLKSLDGQPLVQYFSLQTSGNLQLGNRPPGAYQFALIADDGATFSLTDNNGNPLLTLNDDGNHSNRIICSQVAVAMEANSVFPFKLNYFQGPPTRIALMLLWRKVDPTNPQSMVEPLCPSAASASTQNDTYFFSNDPQTDLPVATTNFTDMELPGRSWEIIPSTSYSLQAGQVNPCH